MLLLSPLLLLLLLLTLSPGSHATSRSILIAGSLNVDTFLPIARFPSPGENLTLLPHCEHLVDIPGGKGMNQAISACKLSLSRKAGGANRARSGVAFLGQFGNDAAADILRKSLTDNDVDISLCGTSEHPSGRGYVMLVPETGEVAAVVSGGSNHFGWRHFDVGGDDKKNFWSDERIEEMVASHSLVLLQCEIPNFVNQRLARAAKKRNVPVILDVGGEDRKIDRELLECCDYLVPNETELDRLSSSFADDNIHHDDREQLESIQSQLGEEINLSSVCKAVSTLQKNGANHVLVTLGSRGSILFRKHKKTQIIYQPACTLPSGSSVVDETGAGDCYRAAFAVALLEHCSGDINNVDDETLRKCMNFASAAGALAVTKKGAVPSIPSREEVEKLMKWNIDQENIHSTTVIPRGGMMQSDDNRLDDDFPFMFGSRLNSMKDRRDLLDPSTPMSTPRDFVRRQATIRGLGCVDFNYPQHFMDYWTPEEAKQALDEFDLVAGAVCLRYPSKFARGAMNHPDPEMRREAIEMTKDAARVARILGCNEVVVWSAYDGYDYPFQVNYKEKWNQIVSAFQECCDAYPDIKWSLEYKPTDENTRFFTVPSTGAAMLMVKEINRPNMGLTLDMGHMLMSGENPGQSISMVGDKLFGIQLNDGYTRLAAEDGMMFGSIHPSMALEAIYQLRINNFRGHLYFDTFPQRTDPVKECEYNIKRVKEFWRAVEMMNADEIHRITMEHDALGALELVNEALRQ
ncbi:hypothetical protein ACHAW6_012623 [Cyclotella cf. meneghiniana]